MKKHWIRSASLAVALALPACGDDATTPPTDTSVQDTSVADTTPDTTPEDTTPDTTPEDTTPDTTPEDTTPDTTPEDTTPDTTVEDTTPDTTPEDTTPDTTVEDTTPDTTVEDTTPDTTVETASLEDLLAPFADSTNGFTTSPAKRVEGLVVTLIKPVVGTEDGGFFVQAAADGPAVFVEVDGDLPAEVVVGATLDLQVDQMINDFGVVRVRAFSNLSQTATGADLTTFKTNLDDVATADGYLALANRLISLEGDITNNGDPAGGGSDGYRRYTFTSAGVASGALDAEVQVRVPRAIVDATGLEAGCAFEILTGAVWSFRDNGADKPHMAQPSVYSADAFTAVCPAPTVSGAEAPNNTTVTVTFTRPLDATTVNVGAFSIEPTLGVTDVELAADGRSVTLTTAEQLADEAYTVTVATSVTDVLGEALTDTVNSASFTGAAGTAPEVLPAGAVWCFNGSSADVTLVDGLSDVSMARDTRGDAPLVRYDGGNPGDLAAGCDVTANTGYSTSQWTVGAFDESSSRYLEVTFSHGAGRLQFSFDARRSPGGPRSARVWSSVLGDLTAPVTIATSFAPYATTAFAVEATNGHTIRIYGWDATDVGGNMRLDNIAVRFAPAD